MENSQAPKVLGIPNGKEWKSEKFLLQVQSRRATGNQGRESTKAPEITWYGSEVKTRDMMNVAQQHLRSLKFIRTKSRGTSNFPEANWEKMEKAEAKTKTNNSRLLANKQEKKGSENAMYQN